MAGVHHDDAREIALSLPGVEEGTSYGTPAFRVRKKMFLRFHDDGETLVVHADHDARGALIAADPAVFHVTDHYRDYTWVLVRMGAVSRTQLEQVVEHAWRARAPARLRNKRDS